MPNASLSTKTDADDARSNPKRYPYWALRVISVLMGWVAHQTLHPSYHTISSSSSSSSTSTAKQQQPDEESMAPELALRQIIQCIVQLPAFLCLVVQGIFGGTPWDMMSCLLLLMDWRGFTKQQIVAIPFTSGLTSMLGGWLVEILGDYVSQRSLAKSNSNANNGTGARILLGRGSVTGGIPLYGLFLYATDYQWALLWINAFQLWATWCLPGACKPMCAELPRNPSERAQIVALWLVMEKGSGAIFGAPLVGYLTSNMLPSSNSNNDQEKAEALAWNLFFLSSLFWSICAFFWVLMAFTFQKGSFKASPPGTSSSRHRQEGTIELNSLL